MVEMIAIVPKTIISGKYCAGTELKVTEPLPLTLLLLSMDMTQGF